MSTGTITFSSGKGWYFAEDDVTHYSIFVHIRDVEGQRHLRVDDRIQFDLADNPKHPGKTCAVNVKYIGHVITRQISDEKAVRS